MWFHSLFRRTRSQRPTVGNESKTSRTTTILSAGLAELLEPRVLLTGSPYEDRGRVSVIVDNTLAASITAKLDQFEQDLIGDGWAVSVHTDAPRMKDNDYIWDNDLGEGRSFGNENLTTGIVAQYAWEIQIIKDMINADNFDGQLKQVILIGHVTVPYSGWSRHDGHENRAFPADAYYADLDATPATWGDDFYDELSPNGNDTQHELTTNEPGDGRFDASAVPGHAQVVTVSGSGTFQLTFSMHTTDPIEVGASAEQLREELNELDPIALAGFVTVIESASGVYTVNFFGDNLTAANQPAMTWSGSSGVSVSIEVINNGGIEMGIGRIDMANLDAAFPTNETPFEFESRLINQYLQRNHEWRLGMREVAQRALLDPVSGPHQGGLVDASLKSVVGNGNVDYDLTWLEGFEQTDPTHYLFASALDGGQEDAIWHTYAPTASPPILYPEFASYHFNETPVNAVFSTVLGSWMGDWNNRSLRAITNPNGVPPVFNFTGPSGGPPDLFPWDSDHRVKANLMRSLLGADGDALVSTVWEPSRFGATAANGWFGGDHPLTLGWPAGDGFRDGFHNSQLGDRGQVVQQLLGDPTVRMSPVKPPIDVRAQTILNASGEIIRRRITWEAPETGLLGYRLYRSSSMDGPFAPIHTGLWGELSFNDDEYTSTTPAYYMVRAIKEQSIPNSSETYVNASQGIVARTTAAHPSGQTFHFANTHKITVQFDRNVQSALSNTDLILDNLTTGEQIPVANIGLSDYNTTTNTATLSFINIEDPGYANETILPDGNYGATIAASDVLLNGEEMTEDMVFDFFVLSGDANRTRTVNLDDFNILAANFGQSPRDFTQGDFNYDGVVNLSDFDILAGQFGTMLDSAPLEPSVISVSVLERKHAEISWLDDVDGETGWRVQWTYDPTSFSPSNHIDIPGDPGVNLLRTFSVGEFTEGTRVWLRIRAYSDPGGPNTGYSPKRGATMLLPPPTNLQLMAVAGRVDLSWQIDTEEADLVFIQRSTNGFEWETIHQQEASDLTYSDTSVTLGTRYYYRVYLHNDDIDSAPSFIEQIVA